MGLRGFSVGNSTYKYEYDALEGKPSSVVRNDRTLNFVDASNVTRISADLSNIEYRGTNPIESATNDTPVTWKTKGNGLYWISSTLLKKQPEARGFLKNIVLPNGDAVVQYFVSTSGTTPSVYWRMNNNSAWSSWIDDTPASRGESHNSVFRGKYLGSQVTDEQYVSIRNGTFDDLYIGDYWTINNVNYRIAAFDYYLNTGSSADDKVTQHHVAIVPDVALGSGKMHSSDSTSGMYNGCKMRSDNMASVKSIVQSAFQVGHIMTHSMYLPSAVDGSTITQKLVTDASIELMCQRHVFGEKIHSSYAYEKTIDRTQFPLFALNAKYQFDPTTITWLWDAYGSKSYVCITQFGQVNVATATTQYGIRPFFCIVSDGNEMVEDDDTEDVTEVS